jgi:Relaxase/Mobilisation nuclease domain
VVPKISPARESARSCFEYDIRPKAGQPRGEWVAGTLQGTPRQMARIAGAYRALRSDCLKPVWRCSLSLPPSDGRPSAEKWAEIAQDFLSEMGVPPDASWVAIHHGDVDHDHIHITLLRTLRDGSLWNEERSARRAIKACQKLEAIHQLTSHDRTPKRKDKPTRAETEIFQRQQKKGQPVMSRDFIQSAVDQILLDHPPPKGIDFEDLQRLLADLRPKPIDLQASMPKGVLRGVSYQFDSFKWPGSKIGRKYSVGLAERGVRMPSTKSDSTAQTRVDHGSLQSPTAARDPYARAPGALRQILSNGNSANQMVPRATRPISQFSDRLPDIDIRKTVARIGGLNIGPVSQAMLILGAAGAHLGIVAVKALINFLQKLLALFGIGLRPVSQNISGAEQSALGYEPYIKAEMRLVDEDLIEKASELILQTADAIKEPATAAELLPAGEGRAELVAALQKNEVVAAEAAEPTLNDIFAGLEINAVQAPEAAQSIAAATSPAVPQKPLWVAFTESVEALKLASATVDRARLKDLPVYFDGRSKAWRQRDDAEAGLQKLEADFLTWRNAHRVVSALGSDPQKFGQRIAAQKRVVNQVAALVRAAEKQEADAESIWKKTPAPVVSAAILDKEKAASSALRESRILLMAKAQQNLKLIGDQILRQQMAVKLQRLDGRFDSFLANPKTQPKFVNDLEPVLREIHFAVALERARLAPAPDAEPVDPDSPRAA